MIDKCIHIYKKKSFVYGQFLNHDKQITQFFNTKGNHTEVALKRLENAEQIWSRKGQIHVSKWRDNCAVLFVTINHHSRIIAISNKYAKRKINQMIKLNIN